MLFDACANTSRVSVRLVILANSRTADGVLDWLPVPDDLVMGRPLLASADATPGRIET